MSRRISSLEVALGTLLFEKSRTSGFVLTAEGQRLLSYAEAIESTLHMACEQVSGSGVALSGHVRMGCTEGFGSFFITPQLSHFVDAYPAISVDILPLPHFISLSKREADIVIALERPEHGPYVCCKLCDYRLRLYATRDYLDNHEPILRSSDLARHPFISYVDDLAFSSEAAVPGQPAAHRYRTPAQHKRDRPVRGGPAGSRAGHPAVFFLAAQDPRLVPVLPGEVEITRQFWMYCREDLRKLKRITLLWDYIRDVTRAQRAPADGRVAHDEFCRLVGGDHDRHAAVFRCARRRCRCWPPARGCQGRGSRRSPGACPRPPAPWPRWPPCASTAVRCSWPCRMNRYGHPPAPARCAPTAVPCRIRSTISRLWVLSASRSLPNSTLPDRPKVQPSSVGVNPSCLSTAICSGVRPLARRGLAAAEGEKGQGQTGQVQAKVSSQVNHGSAPVFALDAENSASADWGPSRV